MLQSGMAQAKTHEITRAQVIETVPGRGEFAIVFTFDDGTEDFGIVGSKTKAQRCAKASLGIVLPIGVLPMGTQRRVLGRRS